MANYAATIGFFDGVHRGHRFLIEQLKTLAREREMQSMVITFEQHPRHVVHPEWRPQLLTTPEEKTTLLKQTGIDVLELLHFDTQMAALSARQFMQWLHAQLGVDLLLTGYDNRFGHNRTEGFADYERYGREIGIEVVEGQPFGENGQRFSSSLTRHLIAEGRMKEATFCLGRPYTLTGRVVHGEQIGRTLGFPTANIQVCNEFSIIPQNGVYCVNVYTSGQNEPYIGMMNIGMRPTFEGHRQTLEVNLFDFKGDLYDQLITVAFIDRLREERTFSTPEALARQMEADAKEARMILDNKV